MKNIKCCIGRLVRVYKVITLIVDVIISILLMWNWCVEAAGGGDAVVRGCAGGVRGGVRIRRCGCGDGMRGWDAVAYAVVWCGGVCVGMCAMSKCICGGQR